MELLNCGGISLVKHPEEATTSLDMQLGRATLLLKQNTNSQVPANVNKHLREALRVLYYQLVEEQRGSMAAAD